MGTNADSWHKGEGRVPIVDRGTHKEMLNYYYDGWRNQQYDKETGLPTTYPSLKSGHWDTASGKYISAPPDSMAWPMRYEFEDDLRFIRVERGRSKTLVHLESVTDGALYPMVMREFSRVLRHKTLVQGQFHGRFTQAKRGANYTLVCLDVPAEDEGDDL